MTSDRFILSCCSLWLAFGSLCAWAQSAPVTTSVTFSNEVEASLVKAMETLKGGSIVSALQELDVTLQKNPNFRLGHLIRGDLLMAKAGQPIAFNNTTSPSESMANLRDEARVRLTRYFDAPPSDYLPSALLQLAPEQRHALLVDSAKSRLYVFKNVDGKPTYVADFYISSGRKGMEKLREGDQKTPIGVYHVTSTIAKEKLTDLYGPGAFPLNYPNEWDKRLGKNGSGIWIHGTPSDTYSRPPRASDGCVVLTNDDFGKVSQFVDPGLTPVVIMPTVAWAAPDSWGESRSAFIQLLSRWKSDWESLKVEDYLQHYSAQFQADGKDFESWASYKRRVNAGKSYVQISINNVSAFEYALSPDTPPLMMVTFDQEYKSSNSSSRMKKRQYWQLEGGNWKIIYESAAS